MTPQEITHYSELMAKFEGAIPAKNWQGKDGFKSPIYEHEQWSNRIQGYFDTDVISTTELRFHTSYDWLHRVWMKFRDLNIPINEFNDIRIEISTELVNGTLEEAFLELGRAIEWYEQIKK